MSFSRGSNIWLGYNLGYAMLSLGMAALTSRYDMEPEQTDFRIVDLERAYNLTLSTVNGQPSRIH